MIDTLNSYLAQHKSISIPGVGTLYLERMPAQLDTGSRQLLPPAFVYRFDKFNDTPLKDFFCFIAGHKNIPEYEAINMYNEFAAAFRQQLKMEEEAAWNGAGTFKKDLSGEIIFEQAANPFLLFTPVTATEITRAPLAAVSISTEGIEHAPEIPVEALTAAETINKNWWLYALALFITGIVVLCFHFYSNGTTWHAFFNQQLIN